jgi:hypothetical protein
MRLPAALAALAALAVLGACASPATTGGSYAEYQRDYQTGLAPGASATDAAVAEAAADPAAESHAGISDEQDFSAVSSRETIESDKERIAQNRAQYQVIAPTALPERTETSAPNLISYALNAPSRLGQPYYKRGGLALSSNERACARYQSPEDAQLAFLKSGGPERDRRNLDPDGDGFACTWDPTPFQKVRG